MRRDFLAVLCGIIALGSGPSAAQGAMTLRDRLMIVSSASSANVSRLLSENFADRFEGVVPPDVQSVGSTRAMELFCTGIGPQTADIAIATRRMPRSLIENCVANGVTDIVELQIGFGAIVIAARRGDPTPALTSRQIWSALAAEQPVNHEFSPNRHRLWSDVSPTLPRTPIRFTLPSPESGTFLLFNDLVMEAGCRSVPDVRLIFEAAYRLTKCVTTRTDGVLRTVAAAEVPSALMAAAPGTLAAITYDQLIASGGNLVALSLDGSIPTVASIAADEYGQGRPFYLYAKRQHSRSQNGVGVVRGIREFLAEVTSENAAGPSGYLAQAGLVPLPPADRASQRRIALTSTLMSR